MSKPPLIISGKDFNDCLVKTKAELLKRGINFNSASIAKQIRKQNNATKDDEKQKKNLTLAEAVKGALAVLRSIRQDTCASNNEIQRRAAICAVCPLKTRVSDCMSCGAGAKVTTLANKIQASFGNKIKIPKNIIKDYCSVCGCSLATMVVTKYSDLSPESPQKVATRPAFCWLNPSSNNFTKE